CHRMIGVAEQHLSILDGYTCGAQAARERVSKIVNAHPLQSFFTSRALPRRVVHRTNLFAPRYANTQIGCKPRCDSIIDHATSFRMATWARLDLNASGGIANTFRPISGTRTSQAHSSPQT